MKFLSRTLLALSVLSTCGSLSAQTLYWDTNGATPGAGNPANGTWNSSNTNWSTSAAGDIATSAYVATSTTVFSAGSDALTGSVAVSGAQNTLNMTVASGSIAFSGSQIEGMASMTIASGASASFSNSLRFNGTGNPTLIANGNIAGANLTSNGTITKSGVGTVSFATVDANVTVSGGTMIASGGNKTKSVLVNNGGTFRVAGNNTIIDSFGVTVDSGGSFELAAGVADSINTLNGAGSVAGGTGSVLTIGSSNGTSALSGALSGQLSVVKNGTGTQTFSGVNANSGNLTVNAGTVTLADNGAFTFYIGADGVNNSLLGAGILNLNGDFIFNLSGADSVGSWTIVDVINLSETYGSTFTVQGFTETSAGVWHFGGYTFTEATGVLTAVPEPSAVLLTGLGFTLVLWRGARRVRA
jgi:fibronectin-binding autotransporter adhesin